MLIIGVSGFKELAGAELPPSPWLSVTQQRTNDFARVTGDVQWIHTDPERAASNVFGSTISHGFLTLALIPHLWHSVAQVESFRMTVNYGLDDVRFPAAVTIPSRIRARFKIMSVVDVPGGIQTRLGVSIEREGEVKPACVAEMLVRHYV